MNERSEPSKAENIESDVYGLRAASASDVDFLFRVSTEAMQPVVSALNPDKIFDKEAEFKEYQEKFVPEEIKIITYASEDVGRLRVVRNDGSIYVGGIQILPEFQGKGIGTAIFKDLVNESNKKGLPVTLEVHDVNLDAIEFYKSLGFESVGHEEKKTHMKYSPISLGDK